MSSRLFPVAPTGRNRFRETHVIWDMDGYSIPAESLCPYSITEQIKTAIKEEGFLGNVSFHVYCDSNAWPIELQDKFWRGGFDICPCRGDKLVSRYTLVADLVYWSFTMQEPKNLLILSENKDKFEKDGKFSRLRKALENRGCTITSAHPDTLFTPICKINHFHESCGCSEETCLAE